MADRDYDLLFDAADGVAPTHRYVTANIDGAQTLNPEGKTFDMKLDSALAVGDRVTLTDASASPDIVTHCVITGKVASPPTLTLRPLFSDADTGDESGIAHEFPDNSIVVPEVGHDGAVLVLDLAEAPDASYEYIVVACGQMAHNESSSRAVNAWVRRTLLDDPVDGDIYGEARVTLPNAGGAYGDTFNYVGASHHVLDGGQRYEFRSQFKGVPASGFASRFATPRLMAIRIDPNTAYIAGDGKTAETTYASDVGDYLSLPSVPAGDYLLVASWQLNVDETSPTGSESADATLWAPTPIARHRFNSIDANDFYPGGFIGKITLATTDEIKLRVRGLTSHTAKVRHGLIAAIPLSSLPDSVTHQLKDPGNVALSDDQWASLEDSGAKTLSRQRHVAIIGTSAVSSERFEIRPKYGNPNITNPTGLGLHAQTLNGDDPRQATFFFHRSEYADGDVTTEIEGRIPDDPTGGTIQITDAHFTWLAEKADIESDPSAPIANIADLKPGIHIKNMAAGGATDRFKKAFPEIGLFCGVRVNSEDYTEVSSTGAMTAKSWYWDKAARELYIQYESGDSPSDDDIYTVVQPLITLGKFHHDLVDADGNPVPYASRIDGVPDAAQDLSVRDGKYRAGTTLGSLELANGDGEYDDKHAQWRWDGWPVRLRRGHPTLSNDLKDFEVVADAIMGRPDWSPERMRIGLFDRSQLLRKTVKLVSHTVKEGYAGDGNNGPRDRDDQEVPVLYGKHKRIVAYRTEANEGAGLSNNYYFASNSVASVDAAYLTADAQKAVDLSTHWAGDSAAQTIDRALGRIDLANNALDDASEPPDVIYLDVTGNFPTVGELFEAVIKTQGGQANTDLVRSSFRWIDRGGRRQLDLTKRHRPIAVNVGLRIDSGERIADVLDRVAEQTGIIWAWNRQGRAYLDVPDFDAGNVLTNGFFELDAASPWPWEEEENASLSVSTSRSFAFGDNSLEIANGSDADAYAVQRVLLHRPGDYAITLVALSVSGEAGSFRIGVLGPDGEEQLSPAQTLSTTAWTRVTFPFRIARGHVGRTEIRIYPAKDSTTATTVGVDAVEGYHLAAIAEQNNSEVLGVEYEDDDAYETAVGFDRNQQDGRSSTATADHAEALGLSTTEPEGKHVVGSAGTIDLTDALITDAASAAGVAASLTATHGRQRTPMRIMMKNLDRIPILGDRIMHRNHPRIPESADSYPFWRVVESSYDGDDAQDVLLRVRRQIDPALDRMEVV